MNMDGMETSSAHYNQETLETMLVCTKSPQDPKKPRPQPEHSLKCPRCDSTNTKFCYYNNYNLNQPRYFCKSCKRYWTKGGTLRNVPVGGGCRRNKRSSSSSKLRNGQDHSLSSNPSPLSGLGYDSSDLSLAFSRLQDGHDLSVMGSSGCGLNGLFGNFVEAPSGFQNLYYGNGFANLESGFENGGMGINHGVIGYDQEFSRKSVAIATSGSVKQEYCSGREGEQRVLLGFPWQIGGNENIGGDFENSGRGNWNGIGATWHGLLNSPLV